MLLKQPQERAQWVAAMTDGEDVEGLGHGWHICVNTEFALSGI
jgi:hypothetical protein